VIAGPPARAPATSLHIITSHVILVAAIHPSKQEAPAMPAGGQASDPVWVEPGVGHGPEGE